LSESGFELTSRGEAFAKRLRSKTSFRKAAETLLQQFLERKAPFFSAACSLKQNGWEMWTSPIELLPKVAEDAEFRKWCDRCRYAAREQGKSCRASFDWIFWPREEIFETLRARTLSLHGIHDLAEMVDVRYRVLRGDPERVAALIPAGQPVRESSKSSSKTVAKNAEQQRRRELEAGFHNVKEVRQQRIRRLSEIVDEYLSGLPPAVSVRDLRRVRPWARFAPDRCGDGCRYRRSCRAPLSGGAPARESRAQNQSTEETENLTAKARTSRSPHMYPAFMLARNAGLRDTEIKTLTWGQVNLKTKSLQVGRSKSDAGEGRVVPLNSDLYNALLEHTPGIRSALAPHMMSGTSFPLASPCRPTRLGM
jgi:hypothetical protein